MNSPYCYVGNRVIVAVDPDGNSTGYAGQYECSYSWWNPIDWVRWAFMDRTADVYAVDGNDLGGEMPRDKVMDTIYGGAVGATMNGILNEKAGSLLSTSEDISVKFHKNQGVIAIHNKSGSGILGNIPLIGNFAADLVEAGLSKIGIRSAADEALEKYSVVANRTGSSNFTWHLHSEGAILGSTALYSNSSIRTMIEVRTYAGAAWSFPSGLKGQPHFFNPFNIVPGLLGTGLTNLPGTTQINIGLLNHSWSDYVNAAR